MKRGKGVTENCGLERGHGESLVITRRDNKTEREWFT